MKTKTRVVTSGYEYRAQWKPIWWPFWFEISRKGYNPPPRTHLYEANNDIDAFHARKKKWKVVQQ